MTVAWSVPPDESDDVLDGSHRVRRELLGTDGAVGEHRVDVGGIGREPLHLGPDRAELGDREVGERSLEGRELSATELLEHGRLGEIGERRIEADEIVRLGSWSESL